MRAGTARFPSASGIQRATPPISSAKALDAGEVSVTPHCGRGSEAMENVAAGLACREQARLFTGVTFALKQAPAATSAGWRILDGGICRDGQHRALRVGNHFMHGCARQMCCGSGNAFWRVNAEDNQICLSIRGKL